jgi:hypothetical protein
MSKPVSCSKSNAEKEIYNIEDTQQNVKFVIKASTSKPQWGGAK